MSQNVLGLDCGTQSIRATIINEQLKLVAEVSVVFDKELSHYGTTGGCHRKDDRVTAPPQMWIEAMDMVMKKLKDHPQCPPLSTVVGVSFSGQQHGSVYWRKGAARMLANLNPDKPLLPQLASAFAIDASPIWMDSSTQRQCRRLENAVGGPERLAAITGSRAYERFTGNQIAKIIEDMPQKYEDCERISVVSSFLASLWLGAYSPIDTGDGAGMNILDIHSKQWHIPCLNSVVQSHPQGINGLLQRLGKQAVESHAVVGDISPYWVSRLGFSPKCKIVAASGDNNNSLIGMKSRGNDIVVSLGTSDTVTSSIRKATPGLEGHVLCHPIMPDGFMAMLCFANGSLCREAIRDQFAGGDWARFNAALDATPIGNDGFIGFYFMTQEIIPQHRRKGVYRFAPDGTMLNAFPKHKNPAANYDIRAVLEGQFLSRRLHSAKLGMRCEEVSRIVVCGGAAANNHIVQVLADVFGVPVYRDAGTNAASYGAALRALHGVKLWQAAGGRPAAMGLSERVFEEISRSHTPLEKICDPRKANHDVYNKMLPRFAALENRIPFESKL